MVSRFTPSPRNHKPKKIVLFLSLFVVTLSFFGSSGGLFQIATELWIRADKDGNKSLDAYEVKNILE